jgi:putative endopeptidase
MKTIKAMLKVVMLFLAVTPLLTYSQVNNEITKKSGFDITNLDRNINPAKDFYEFAVGGWVKIHPIPDDQTRWGSFDILQEENNKILKKILDEVSSNKNWEIGSARQKIADFYSVAMDSDRIEKEGYKLILPELKKIDALSNMDDFYKLLAEYHLSGMNPLFDFSCDIDAKRSSIMVSQIYQRGVALPDVEYYTKDDARSKEIRAKYLKHVTNMFKLIGTNEETAQKNATIILELETRLAKASNTRIENRDPIKTYNKMLVDGLKSSAAGFDWDTYFTELGVGNKVSVVVVAQPKFIAEVGNMMKDVSLDKWKVYLKWNLLNGSASYLSSSFINELFNFRGKFLNGAKVIQPRWKRVLAAINRTMGELLGQIYVAETFPPEAKAKAQSIVSTLLKSMGESIKNLDWMSPSTKEKALEKLSSFGVKIGYPDKWTDYSKLEIGKDDYVTNAKKANMWAKQDELSKIGKPVDKTEWGMSPQTVNAYYSAERNEIVFPAAILQWPFFSPESDDAVNYGAMGVVIGHEITHGFDDQGRKFDAHGNINDWWTNDDAVKFNGRAKKLVDEFNSFIPIDSMRVNGSLTLGENIADLGGLTISFNAFKNTDQYKKGESIDGFTPSQRFYLGYAQVWANSIRDEALKLRLKTDSHSPGKQRVLGPLMNLPEFFQAFDVKPGDPMRNPDDKIVKIW